MSEPAPSPIIDTTTEWVKEQIDEYVATDGAKPTFPGGAPLLLLTTRGRKSGEWRRTCLIGAEYEGDYLVVASMGGAPKHPTWYLNLVENPRVWLQVGAEQFWATARTATDAEKPARWEYMVSLFGNYAEYQRKTERAIPVVILERER